LLIGATFSGGGAGDTTYRFLACPAGATSCELLGSIDSNSDPAPQLVQEASRIFLVVNGSDYIFDFRSFSRMMEDLAPGTIFLRYRDAGLEGRRP
jgi:hypothetical protein